MKKYVILMLLVLGGLAHAMAQSGWRKLSEDFVFEKPPFDQGHASTIVEVAPGKLLAACFGGTKEGNKDVCIWMAACTNGVWEKPRRIAEGIINDTLRHPCWNPVLFKEKSGLLYLFYKVGPATRLWWGEYMTSADDGKTWSAHKKLPSPIFGPIKNKPVQLADGTILSPSSALSGQRRIAIIEKSVDGGRSWTSIPVDTASQIEATQPSLLLYPNGRMQVLCRGMKDTLVQAWSYDMGNTWKALSHTSLLNPNSGTDALTLKNGSQLLVYNPTVKGTNWYNGREKLAVATSNDGIHWKEVLVLEAGRETQDYSYPAVIQAADGKVHITYSSNRRNIRHVVLEQY